MIGVVSGIIFIDDDFCDDFFNGDEREFYNLGELRELFSIYLGFMVMLLYKGFIDCKVCNV